MGVASYFSMDCSLVIELSKRQVAYTTESTPISAALSSSRKLFC